MTDTTDTTDPADPVRTGRAAVAAAFREQSEAAAAVERQQRKIEREQEVLVTLTAVHASTAALIVTAQSELALAEEQYLAQTNLELAKEIIRRHTADPIGNSAWVIEQAELLRSRVPVGTNTMMPGILPFLYQALSILPPLAPMDTPAYHLVGDGTAWRQHRAAILAAAVPA